MFAHLSTKEVDKTLALPNDKEMSQTARRINKPGNELVKQTEEEKMKIGKQLKINKEMTGRHDLKMALMKRGVLRVKFNRVRLLMYFTECTKGLHLTIFILCLQENTTKDTKHDLIATERQKALLEVNDSWSHKEESWISLIFSIHYGPAMFNLD